MSRTKLIVLGALAAPLVLYLVLLGAWAVWGSPGDGIVASGVVLAGVDVSGSDAAALESSVNELAASFAQTPVEVSIPDATLTSTTGELGLSVDAAATAGAAMKIGHNDPVAIAPLRWVRSWFADRNVDVALHVERDAADAELARIEADHRSAAVEPSMQAEGDSFVLSPGVDGKALEVDQLLDELPSAVNAVGSTISVELEQRSIAPTIGDDAVQTVVDKANRVVGATVTVRFGDDSFDLDGATLASGLSMELRDGTPTLVLAEEPAALQLVANLPTPLNPTNVRFTVINGVPTPQPGTDAQVCCTDDSPQLLIDAFLSEATEVSLTPRTMTAAEGVEWANTLGVKEVIGEFTTRHACCANRVKNIHRFADLTNGYLIAPGATFSANDTVGRRTVEKGFFIDGVIEQGRMSKDVGGGVSQWATTAFNAAFFAGLDIPAHKPHSLYISRYPYGREATLSYPGVDLKIKNNTPYGVVIWSTYTDTSITVQMWSTRYVVGEQTAISRTSGCGANGNVTVTRTRTWNDGHTENDTFTHRYNCEQPAASPETTAPAAAPAAPAPPAPSPE